MPDRGIFERFKEKVVRVATPVTRPVQDIRHKLEQVVGEEVLNSVPDPVCRTTGLPMEFLKQGYDNSVVRCAPCPRRRDCYLKIGSVTEVRPPQA